MSLYPAIKGEMGDWTYFLSSVAIKDAVKHFHFAHEIVPYSDLDQIVQRELSSRSKQIASYLKNNQQRLFGALTVAVYGGQPRFSAITLEASSVLPSLEGRIGVLGFDGDEQYYVLDGQHRLAAMKDLAKEDSESEALKDDVSILLVAHKQDNDGIQRARRLFTNLNRYAGKTSKTVNIVLDEDDPYAIITRYLIRDNIFLKRLTKIAKSSGSKSLATGESLSGKPDKKYLFTITTFYECNKALLNGRAPDSFMEKQLRPSDEDLETGYKSILESWNGLFTEVPFLRACKEAGDDLDLMSERSPDGGHVLARPIGIKSFCYAVGNLPPGEDSWKLAGQISDERAQIEDSPWVDLMWRRDGKMFYGKDRVNSAISLWEAFLGLDVDADKVEADWLNIVDPERNSGITLDGILSQ